MVPVPVVTTTKAATGTCSCCLTNPEPEPDAIDDIKAGAATSVKKVLRKGRVIIIKNGKEYNPDGTQIK